MKSDADGRMNMDKCCFQSLCSWWFYSDPCVFGSGSRVDVISSMMYMALIFLPSYLLLVFSLFHLERVFFSFLLSSLSCVSSSRVSCPYRHRHPHCSLSLSLISFLLRIFHLVSTHFRQGKIEKEKIIARRLYSCFLLACFLLLTCCQSSSFLREEGGGSGRGSGFDLLCDRSTDPITRVSYPTRFLVPSPAHAHTAI